MASNNNTTRIDVQVNTQNAKNKLRELADEAKKNNIDANRLEQSTSNIGNKSAINNSGKEAAEEARRVAKEIEREKKAQVANEHRELRRQNSEEFNEVRKKHRSGKLSDDEYEEERKKFQEAQLGSYADERAEKREIEQDQLNVLEEILDALRQAEKGDTVDNQRDNDEFRGKGILGELFEKRSRLQAERLASNDEGEIKEKTKELRGLDARINKFLGVKKGSAIADTLSEGGDLVSSTMAGNAGGAAMGALSKAGPYGIAAAAIGAAIFGVISRVGGITTATAPLASLRAQGGRDDIRDSGMGYRDSFQNMGMTDKDQWQFRYDLAMSSGIGSRGDAMYAAHAAGLEKGYGIKDIAGLSTNERGDKYGKATSDNILEMLNVLGQIRDGSIKPNDLTLANEKANLMVRMQSSQLSRREQFDTREILSTMSAFEKLGGSGKDMRAGDFMEGAFAGVREGGDKNQMLLKIQAAKEAHPELANNQVALAKIVEKGDDPAYLASAVKMLKRITAGDEVSSYYLMKKMFPQLTVEQREMLHGANNEFFETLKGNRYSKANIYNSQDALSYAEKNTAWADQASAWSSDAIDDVTEGVKNIVKNTGDMLEKMGDKVSGWFGGGTEAKGNGTPGGKK